MQEFPIDSLRFDTDGLIPAIVQHVDTKDVLMLGFMNREAVLRTVNEGKVCFWSRSRQKFWLKGETSGMFLLVRGVRVNCENNSLLVFAEPIGPTCHTGHSSCFYRQATDQGEWNEVMPVITSPEDLYAKS
ncbi:MAG: phosphoribosyl-AMP cyclohydrolase [Proteobacteria bacterium]|nr:MAG: phosphoribosyl-AMP cyclohydrolase [Pseudomonadota bacterium]